MQIRSILFCIFKILFRSILHITTAIKVKFGRKERTYGLLLPAKFDLDQCNVSPLRGDKPQNRAVSKRYTGRAALRANPAGKDIQQIQLNCNLTNYWHKCMQNTHDKIAVFRNYWMFSCVILYRNIQCIDSTLTLRLQMKWRRTVHVNNVHGDIIIYTSVPIIAT